ncbi:transcription factor CP2-like protein 1 isoform X2 [Phymastichus coffea]|uniref:transcription factor CP2-like protein 1 isoform X2 n=1 Tax=Phymastichus coffea TaxID=108790 RepID=UPI00273AD5A3|nr:transcription factor CP2-like protein 1 isoform X2 [Phymastichus coffea]
MELQLTMDNGDSEASMWLPASLTYQQRSPDRPNDCNRVIDQQQAPLGCHTAQTVAWQDRSKAAPSQQQQQQQQQVLQRYRQQADSPPSRSSTSSASQSPEHRPSPQRQPQPPPLKRRNNHAPAYEAFRQQLDDQPERKLSRRNGSVGSNDSQGWSSQVDELAEHLAADFDGSLSALAASDLATAVASYNMSEALLALPSLTIFKQEAPSPENQQTNTNLNHVAQQNVSVPPSCHGSNVLVETDSNNGGQNPASLHQLLYTSSEEYPSNSHSGNHVTSSQGHEFGDDCRFQYVLAAATSIATKVNEETLTYLNQGQSYEIKLKKLGDVSTFRGKLLKSTVRICFHERRLQYTEREQILTWQRARPGERLLEVDVPLSYGLVDVCQPTSSNNSIEFMWDPTKEVGCYIKVNCISTEFTPKKHGGEKGVPFRIKVESRIPSGPRLHAASCQVKVFKLKGADRKHKQDRDKIRRQPPHDQDKYQPSYECTILSDIPLDSFSPSNSIGQNICSPYASSDAISPESLTTTSSSSSPVAVPIVPTSDLVKEDIGLAPALSTPTVILSEQHRTDINVKNALPPNANATQTSNWLRARGFHTFESIFANFSASDILRLSRDDLIQICGLADGIRLFNAVHSKAKLCLYFAVEDRLWRAVYLESLTSNVFISKLLGALNLPHERLHSVLLLGPQGIHVLLTNELIANMKDESMFAVEIIKDPGSDQFKLLLKPSSN